MKGNYFMSEIHTAKPYDNSDTTKKENQFLGWVFQNRWNIIGISYLILFGLILFH